MCTPEDEGANGGTRCPVGPSPLWQRGSFYKHGAFSPLKKSIWVHLRKISVEQKYPSPLCLFLKRVSGSLSHTTLSEASGSKAARASRGVLQVEKALHKRSEKHSKPDISSQLIICV